MNISFWNFSLFLTFCFSINTSIAQNDPQYSIYALANYSSSIYKQTSGNETVIPFLSYESDSLFIKQTNIGYHILENVDASITYKGDFFDPNDSDNIDMQLLNKRKGGIYAKLTAKASIFNTSIEQDISGRHDGFSTSVGINLPLFYGPKIPLILRGSISYVYTNKSMSDYLYSVSEVESDLTNNRISTHTSDSTNAIKYGLQAIFPFSKQFTLVTILGYTNYSDEVTASPIISKHHNYSATMIATYKL